MITNPGLVVQPDQGHELIAIQNDYRVGRPLVDQSSEQTQYGYPYFILTFFLNSGEFPLRRTYIYL